MISRSPAAHKFLCATIVHKCALKRKRKKKESPNNSFEPTCTSIIYMNYIHMCPLFHIMGIHPTTHYITYHISILQIYDQDHTFILYIHVGQWHTFYGQINEPRPQKVKDVVEATFARPPFSCLFTTLTAPLLISYIYFSHPKLVGKYFCWQTH